MKALLGKMLYGRPHLDPLPRGEGTAVGHFIIFAIFSSRWPRSIGQATGSVFSSPWGEGVKLRGGHAPLRARGVRSCCF